MKKPFIRQRPFSWQSSEKPGRGIFLNDAASEAPDKNRFPSELVLDLGYLGAVSVFETLRVYQGRIFFLDAHLSRLEESCVGLGRTLPLSRSEIANWLGEKLKESCFAEATFRFSIHWGNGGRGSLVVIFREFKPLPYRCYRRGVALRTCVSRRWTLKAQDAQIKASQFVGGVLAILDRGKLKAHELLFLGAAGTVAEGSISNIFIVPASREKEKRLLTPSVASGILRGVTRSVVLALAAKQLYQVQQTPLTRHDIYSAQECFITNTSSEVLPVSSVDGRKIGRGRPGPVTRMLAEGYKELVVSGKW